MRLKINGYLSTFIQINFHHWPNCKDSSDGNGSGNIIFWSTPYLISLLLISKLLGNDLYLFTIWIFLKRFNNFVIFFFIKLIKFKDFDSVMLDLRAFADNIMDILFWCFILELNGSLRSKYVWFSSNDERIVIVAWLQLSINYLIDALSKFIHAL
jgi:hypothetical protein